MKQGSSKEEIEKVPFDSENEEEQSEAPIGTLPKKVTETELVVGLEPEKIQQIVDRVTSNITGTLETLVVSDRVLSAERNSNEWKKLCHLMMNNPEVINNRMLLSSSPTEMMKRIGPDFTDLPKVS